MTPNDHMTQAMTLEMHSRKNLRMRNHETAQVQATLAQVHATLALAKLQQLHQRGA